MSDPMFAARRERLRRAAEDGERLYRVRMQAPDGPTMKDDFRIDGILTLDLTDALGFVDELLAVVAGVPDAVARAAVIGAKYARGAQPKASTAP